MIEIDAATATYILNNDGAVTISMKLEPAMGG